MSSYTLNADYVPTCVLMVMQWMALCSLSWQGIKIQLLTNWKATQLISKQVIVLVLHLIFHRLTVVKVSFCSLKKGITPKIYMLCSNK